MRSAPSVITERGCRSEAAIRRASPSGALRGPAGGGECGGGGRMQAGREGQDGRPGGETGAGVTPRTTGPATRRQVESPTVSTPGGPEARGPGGQELHRGHLAMQGSEGSPCSTGRPGCPHEHPRSTAD